MSERLAKALEDAEKLKKVIRSRDARRNRSGKGFIYFVQCLDYVKVGLTGGRVSDRLHTMQVNNPLELELFHVLETDQMGLDEQQLHKLFKPYRVRGEWFRLPQKCIDHIKTAVKPSDILHW